MKTIMDMVLDGTMSTRLCNGLLRGHIDYLRKNDYLAYKNIHYSDYYNANFKNWVETNIPDINRVREYRGIGPKLFEEFKQLLEG